jgi:hypothetical protein
VGHVKRKKKTKKKKTNKQKNIDLIMQYGDKLEAKVLISQLSLPFIWDLGQGLHLGSGLHWDFVTRVTFVLVHG